MTLHDPCRAEVPGLHVLVLPGWQNSKGARIEVCVARAKGMEVIEAEEFAA